MFSKQPLKKLYPAIEPFRKTNIQVSNKHSIYTEESGNPNGQPILFVHGGPGGSCSPEFRCYFDPKIYRIILFDQRGCGKSLPLGCIEENTTSDLISDMEKIRENLSISKWILFGGSWGSTLSLLYAQQFPMRVSAMILRGIFLATEREAKWSWSNEGVNRFYPQAWEDLKSYVPEHEQKDLHTAFYKRLTDSNPEVHLKAAEKWMVWETTCAGTDPEIIKRISKPEIALPFARIAMHYAVNHFFIPPNHVLENMKSVEHIPVTIINSVHDFVTPSESAYLLHKKFQHSSLKILQHGGHAPLDPYIIDALVDASDKLAYTIGKKNDNRSLISEVMNLSLDAEPQVSVAGWIRKRRHSNAEGGLIFLQINDGTHIQDLQIVISSKKVNNFQELMKLSPGAHVVVTGSLIKSPASGQDREVQAETVVIFGNDFEDKEYPVKRQKNKMEHLRNNFPHLKERTTLNASIVRVRDEVDFAIRKFFKKEKFSLYATPILTKNNTEAVDQFAVVSSAEKNPTKSDTFLTVSAQLELEAGANSLSRVYTLSPCFRAEPSYTPRHLAEFWMLEAEWVHATKNDVAQLTERLIKFLLKVMLEKCSAEIDFIAKFHEDNNNAKNHLEMLRKIVAEPFLYLDHKDAVQILIKSNHKFQTTPVEGMDLSREHELYLVNEHFKKAIILTDFPKDIKPFYTNINPDGKTCAAFDVLMPGVGEIISGSERESDYEKLKSRMQSKNLSLDEYSWYLDIRKFGATPHAGFGMGLERFIVFACGLNHIMNAIPYPRQASFAETKQQKSTETKQPMSLMFKSKEQVGKKSTEKSEKEKGQAEQKSPDFA